MIFNESKLMSSLSVDSVVLADGDIIEKMSGTVAGYVGPVKTKPEINSVMAVFVLSV